MNPRRFPGSAIGLVTNLNDPEQCGRAKVRFPWLDDQAESYWCRIAATQGGASRGNFLRPEVGDEVLVMFEGGDTNQPYIVGSLWNGADAPPGPGNGDGKNDHKFFQSRSGHQLLFNDGDGGGYIHVHDADGKLHTVFDVPGQKINCTADSGDIVLSAPAGAVNFECVTYMQHSTGDTMFVSGGGGTKVDIAGSRTYTAQSMMQRADAGLTITTPSLTFNTVVFNVSTGGAAVNIGNATATIEPQLQMEYKGPVTRTITGTQKIKARNFRTESDGPSGPMSIMGGEIKATLKGSLTLRAGAGISVKAGVVNLAGDALAFGKDLANGRGMGKAKLFSLTAGVLLLNPGTFTFPMTKLGDLMMGADFHSALPVPPAIPAPFPMMPHGFINPLLLDVKASVLVNGFPLAGTGCTAVGMHTPPSLPLPWAPKPTTYKAMLMGAMQAAFMPAVMTTGQLAYSLIKAKAAGASTEGVLLAGADSPGSAAQQWFLRAFPMCASPGAFAAFLASQMPYPVANGSITIGSPNVLIEDTPASMGMMPFSNSCSDIPVVPNASIMATSNVMVGVDLKAVMEQLAMEAAKWAIQKLGSKALDKIKSSKLKSGKSESPEMLENRNQPLDDMKPKSKVKPCGDPVDPVSGARFDDDVDVSLPGPLPLVLTRHYNSRAVGAQVGGMLGLGWRLDLDTWLTWHEDKAQAYWALHLPDLRYIKLPALTEDGAFHVDAKARIEFCRADEQHYDVTDLDGVVSRFRLDADKLSASLVRRMDRNGNTIELHRDSTDRITGLTDSAGRYLKLDYSGERLASIRLEGREGQWAPRTLRTYRYDREDQLIATVGAGGDETRFVYDERGRVTSKIQPDGYIWRWHYDARDRVTCSYGDDLRYYVAFDHQPMAQATIVEDHAGRKTTYAYNEARMIETILDPAGGLTRLEYDDADNQTSATDPEGGVVTQAFDDHGRLVERVNEAGGQETWTYDVRGWLVEQRDACGAITSYRHDARGNVISERRPDGGETRRRFDAQGQCTVELNDGHEWTGTYEHGLLVEEIFDGARRRHRYDGTGALLQTLDDDGTALVTYERDAAGRITLERRPDGTELKWRYDAMGHVVVHTDGAGGEWKARYDALGNGVHYEGPAGDVLESVYGLDDLPQQHKDGGAEGYTYTYDHAGRITSHRTDDGVVERYHLDGAGRPLAISTHGGGRRFVQHPSGRPAEAEGVDGSLQRFKRDPLGRALSGTERDPGAPRRADDQDPNERRTVFVRRPDGQIVDEVTTHGEQTSRTRLKYGTNQRLLWANYDGVVLNIQRDGQGRVVGVETPHGRFEVSRDGDIERWQTPTGASVLTSGPAWSLRDEGGQPIAGYDVEDAPDEHRLSERFMTAGGGWEHDWTFDASGRLTEGYDERGNRTLDGFAYGRGQRILNDLHGPVIHDARGRIVRRETAEGAQRFTWDDFDRLKEVEQPDGTVVRYTYDAFQRMVARDVDPVEGPIQHSNFRWAGDRMTGETRPDGTELTWIWLDLNDPTPWAVEYKTPGKDPTLHLIHSDQRGAPIAASDLSGRLTWWAKHDAYGQTESAGELDLRVRLAGQWSDPLVGLHYNRHRWYEPTWGRYLSPDPLGVAGGVHRYGYAAGDPIRKIDPLGLEECKVRKAIRETAESQGLTVDKADTIADIQGKLKASGDPWSRAPKSIQDHMAMSASTSGAGEKLIDNLGDSRFKGMEKWEYKVKSSDGRTSVVHYVKDPKTGDLKDFKFKKHSTEGPGNWAKKPDPTVPPGGA